MTLSEDVRSAARATSTLVHQHVALFRAEASEQGRVVGMALVLFGAAVPLVIVGYAGLWVALGLALSRLVPIEVAVLMVAGLNLVAAAVVLTVAVRGLSTLRPLERTFNELDTTARMLGAVLPHKDAT